MIVLVLLYVPRMQFEFYLRVALSRTHKKNQISITISFYSTRTAESCQCIGKEVHLEGERAGASDRESATVGAAGFGRAGGADGPAGGAAGASAGG